MPSAPLRSPLLIPPALLLAGGLVVVALLWVALDTTLYELTGDPLAVAEVGPHVGFLSNLGMLFWASGAGVSLWASFVPDRDGSTEGGLRRLLRDAGLLTVVLVVDDLFMIHDHLIPEHTPVPEWAVLLVIAALVVLFLIRHRSTFVRTPWLCLTIAVAAFGLMLVVDLLESSAPLPLHHAFEEGSKLAGILYWTWWLMLTARVHVLGSVQRPIRRTGG